MSDESALAPSATTSAPRGGLDALLHRSAVPGGGVDPLDLRPSAWVGAWRTPRSRWGRPSSAEAPAGEDRPDAAELLRRRYDLPAGMRPTLLFRFSVAGAASPLARSAWVRFWPLRAPGGLTGSGPNRTALPRTGLRTGLDGSGLPGSGLTVPGPTGAGLGWHFEADRTWRFGPPGPPLWLAATALFGLPGFLGFLAWLLLADPTDPALLLLGWAGGLWALVAPGLLVLWEGQRAGTLATIERAAGADGWSAPETGAVTGWLDRWPRAAAVAGGAAGIVMLALSVPGAVPEGGIVAPALGLMGAAWVGATLGLAVWALAAMLITEHVALQPGTRTLSWPAGEAGPIPGLVGLARLAFHTSATVAMMSVVLLPATYAQLAALPTGIRVGLFLVVIALVLAPALAYLGPSLWIDRVLRSHQLSARDLLVSQAQPPSPAPPAKPTKQSAQLNPATRGVGGRPAPARQAPARPSAARSVSPAPVSAPLSTNVAGIFEGTALRLVLVLVPPVVVALLCGQILG